MQKDYQELERELLSKIERAQIVLGEIGTSKAWGVILEDFGKAKTAIDDNWQYVQDPQKLQELKVTKLAVINLLNTVQNYQHDHDLAHKQLEELRNQATVIMKDYDTEGTIDAKKKRK